jgi:hypothetical protein
MHAQWTPYHTVTFYPNGGSPAPEAKSVLEGVLVAKPADPIKALESTPETAGLYAGQTLEGWHVGSPDGLKWNFDSDPVTGPLNLYAQWKAEPVDVSQQIGDNTFAKTLNYINGQAAANYTIVLDEAISMASTTIDKRNAVITLVGKGPDPTEISPTGNGNLFRVNAGELVLGNNITLQGLSSNTGVYLYGDYAVLTMKTGAAIMGASGSRGVYVDKHSKFNMEGGTISDNTRGGVYVNDFSTFKMEDGTISGNSTTNGGGVYVYGFSTFKMEGGTISGNSATTNGGGVWVNNNATFKKAGTSFIGGDDDGIAYKDNNLNGNPTDNTAKAGNTNGHAVYSAKDSGYYRDSDLDAGADISTDADKLPANGTDYNWTKK